MAKDSLRVHFMGIAGSGMSAVALLSHHLGFSVTGCDLQSDSPYLKKITTAGIPVRTGHHPDHLSNVDILAVSPAVFYQNQTHPEVSLAKKTGRLMTWQGFLGKYLHQGKKVISIAGTNGKSTTTALAGLVLEKAGLDPLAMVGATVKDWSANYKAGQGDYFVTESDEFYDNFLSYHPDIIILNNIEFDHPDFFKSLDQVYQSFTKFIKNIKGEKILIFNQDDPGIKELFIRLTDTFLNRMNLIGYTLKDKPLINCDNSTRGKILTRGPGGVKFGATNSTLELRSDFKISLSGDYNVSNALGVINLAQILNIPPALTSSALSAFNGTGRRMELLGEPQGIPVYDDYGHHPTAIKATLEALRQKYPKNRILAVVEPHSFSRTKALLPQYKGVFSEASEVIIAPIFPARDKSNFGISENSLVRVADHPAISTLDNFDAIATHIQNKVHQGDVVIVFGAGKSYDLARKILGALQPQL